MHLAVTDHGRLLLAPFVKMCTEASAYHDACEIRNAARCTVYVNWLHVSSLRTKSSRACIDPRSATTVLTAFAQTEAKISLYSGRAAFENVHYGVEKGASDSTVRQ